MTNESTSSRDRSALANKDIEFHVHAFTDLHRHVASGPNIINRGEGVYLIDVDGKRYLDAMSSLWCCTLGYSEPRLVDAAHKQLSQLPYSHTFRGRSHPRLIELAERLIELAPAHIGRAFFAGSGSEANESAIKMAWSYHKFRGEPQRRKIISRRHAYHGSTVFASWLSGMSAMHDFCAPPTSDVLFVDCPHYYLNATADETEDAFATRLATNLEQTIDEHGSDSIAAFIAEPVMGVGGVIVPPASYFEKIQAVLRRHGVLFIADEVICGFGRTGELFGSQTFDLVPDMITLAKGISSAYFPLSATLVTDEVFDVLRAHSERNGVFSHGFTYSGHPVGAAVALEALNIYGERNIVANVRKSGALLQRGLRELSSQPLVGEVRGLGLMAAVQLVADKTTREPFDPALGAGNRVADTAERAGLFVRAVGDTIVFAPPLIVTESEVTKITTVFAESLAAATREIETLVSA